MFFHTGAPGAYRGPDRCQTQYARSLFFYNRAICTPQQPHSLQCIRREGGDFRFSEYKRIFLSRSQGKRCGILGFLGIIVTSLDGGGFQFALGDALLIAASFCSVAGTVVTKKATRSVSPLLLVSYSQFFGGLVLSATGLCLGGKITVFDVGAFASFAYICAASIVAYAIWNLLLKYNSLSMLSVIKFSEPLFAVILSGLLLGESIFRLNFLFAFIIILAAILINNLKIRRKQNEKNTASR